jgi:hypothetical protein
MYRYSRASNSAGFRSNHAIDNDTIARYAPSVLATEAHDSRGERYSFIPTINVIEGLRANGFEPFEVAQTRVRDQSRREFTKHMVRLRHPDAIGGQGEVPEIVLVNSHDGTSSYQLIAGMFRFVCSNGLIAGNVCEDIRVRHSGNVVDNVIEGATRIVEELPLITARIDEYKGIQLNHDEQRLFANAALSLRWDEGKAPITAAGALSLRRFDDQSNDLWTTFNRVQENLVRGGIGGRGATGRRMTTRAVGGVNENVKLNRALWSLADGLAQLKTNVIDVEELEVV